MYRAAGRPRCAPVGETEFVNGVAAMSASGIYGTTRHCAGIVGHADLTLGSRVEPVLEAHIRAGGDRFRGIRHITAWDADASIRNPAYSPPPGLLGDTTFREGFAVLGRLGLSFDAWLYHPQIGELADLARAFPETTIVLNHVGGPIGIGAYAGKREEVFPAWAASIKALAACPNVCVKLGGLGMRMGGFGFHEQPEPPSSETLAAAWRPYVETCIEAFGAVALHVRKQLPGRQGLLQLSGVLERLQAAGEGASAAEKADLFAGTAARFYRLDLAGLTLRQSPRPSEEGMRNGTAGRQGGVHHRWRRRHRPGDGGALRRGGRRRGRGRHRCCERRGSGGLRARQRAPIAAATRTSSIAT